MFTQQSFLKRDGACQERNNLMDHLENLYVFPCRVTMKVTSDSSRLHGLQNRWNSPGQNTGVGSLSFLQGIFPTQGSNPGIKPRSPALQVDSLPTELSGDYKEPGSNFQPEERTAKKLAHCFGAILKNGCCVQITFSSYGLFKKWRTESCFDRSTSANQSWKWIGEVLVAAETGSNQLEQRNLHPD